MKQQIFNRLKSLLWRGGMMAPATFFAVLSENFGLLELPPTLTVILGLIFGEISKYLNSPKA